MRKVFSFLLIVMLVLSILPAANPVFAQDPEPESSISVDAKVLQEMELAGSASYWIEFESESDFSGAKSSQMNWSDKGWSVYKQLSDQAQQSQAKVAAYLTNAGIKYHSFWIKNTILVESSDSKTLNNLLNYSEIKNIRPRKNFIVYEPEKETILFDNQIQSIEPNLAQINADDVWGMGITGAGLVVANIDTGVRYSHQALVNQYRGNLGSGVFNHNYNWLDPYATLNAPGDDHGHGTHTMGTMVGDDGGANQIGVAPDAEWIACRGCTAAGCTDLALLTCGEFVAAPTALDGSAPNPDLRPHVVNNSWGDCSTSYDDWYEDVVDAWHAAGIYPIFSNGNASNCGYASPPGLNTVGNPARSGNVTGVGSSGEQNGLYASHSNWGPTDNLDTVNAVAGFENLKPQVVAPGVSIRSSVPGSDTAYEDGWSGTSMSAPHVTGLVALMWQAAPCLIGDYASTERILEETATDIVYDDGSLLTPTNFPNFATGWGEIDALAAINYLNGYCTSMISITGNLTDSASGDPVEQAKIEWISQTTPLNNRISYSTAAGLYTVSLQPDLYDVVVTKYGYQTLTLADFVVDGTSGLLDLTLDPLTLSLVSGTVADGALHGYPLYAQLTYNAPGNTITVYSDPFDGTYQVELFQGEAYEVTVTAMVDGYQPFIAGLTPSAQSENQNYLLFVDSLTCSAPGYQMPASSLYEDFESGLLPTGWVNYDYQGNGQVWQFTDPGGRGNLTPGGEGGFAILDSDNYPSDGSQNAGLRMPLMDFSVDEPIAMVFDSYFRQNLTSSSVEVRLSTDNGVTWITLWTQTNTATETVHVDLSAAAGFDQVIIEFLYQGSWDWYWEVDDVQIITGDCDKQPGGVVAGYVLDENTLDKLIGVAVQSADISVETMVYAGDVSQEGLYWLFQPVENNPEDVGFTVAYTDYPDLLETVAVVPDAVTRHDFSILAPYLTISPEMLEKTIIVGQSGSSELLIQNSGSLDGAFDLFELNGAGIQVETSLVLDDGSAENSIGLTGGGQFLWLNRFTPAKDDFPLILDEVSAVFSDNVTIGDQMQVVIYEDLDHDPTNGALYKGGETFTVTANDLTTWNTFTLAQPIEFEQPCDVLIGLVNRSGVSGVSDFPASIDSTTTQQRSWVGLYSGVISPEPVIPADDSFSLIDALGFAGNWMLRGHATTGGTDVLWLSEDPVTGSALAGAEQSITVQFDSSGLAVGDYQARLMLYRPVYAPLRVPVTLHVVDAILAEDQILNDVVEDTAKEITLAAASTNPASILSYEIVDLPQHGTVVVTGNIATYTPAEDYFGSDSFTFKASDGTLESNVATVTLFVTSVNDEPIAVDNIYEVEEDNSLVISVPGVLTNDSDPDDDELTAVLETDVSDGDLILNANGSFTYTPDTDFNGEVSFAYTACDVDTCGNTATVTLSVTAVNDLPVAVADQYSVDEDGFLNVDAPGVLDNDTDIENDELTAVLGADVTEGTLTLHENGSFLYTPDQDFEGEDSFTYSACDADGCSSAITVLITVTAVNDIPAAVLDEYMMIADQVLEVIVPGVLINDTDKEGDSLEASVVTGVSHGSLTLRLNGSLTYTPEEGFAGLDGFTYQACDPDGACSQAVMVTISVTAIPVTSGSEIYLPFMLR
jgi:VCBS repeat-containing protein